VGQGRREVAMRSIGLGILIALGSVLPAAGAGPAVHPRVAMETTAGSFTLELYPERTPLTVANFLGYVNEGFYDGLIFHRILRGRLIQGGGFTPRMTARPTHAPIPDEADRGLPHERYTIAMARGADEGSATSQFFIDLRDDPGGQAAYCAFGRVVVGMAAVDSIGRMRTVMRGGRWEQPLRPVVILSARVLEPVPAR
jgi:cyclophilin family peptidyl-prolyl cis-trans isomerase